MSKRTTKPATTDPTPVDDTAPPVDTAPVDDATAPPVDDTAPAAPKDLPSTAQLDPPAAPPATSDGENVPPNVVNLGTDLVTQGDQLVADGSDDPIDPETLFTKSADPSQMWECNVRLLQSVKGGDDYSSTLLLVLPKGAFVTRERAQAVVNIVCAQYGREPFRLVDADDE